MSLVQIQDRTNWNGPISVPRQQTHHYGPRPSRSVIHAPGNGKREIARHVHQIAAGSLKAENGLIVHVIAPAIKPPVASITELRSRLGTLASLGVRRNIVAMWNKGLRAEAIERVEQLERDKT